MDRIKQLISHIGVEIPLCIYTITSYFKSPVYQNLIYEKFCLQRYNDTSLCSNVTAYFNDAELQRDAAYLYWISSYVYLIPSLITTLLLGIASDFWNPKIPLIIPFIGVILNTVNCIVQSVFIDSNPYFLLIGDAAFGLCGGYISVISTGMSYGVKTTRRTNRSYRIAGMDGALGLGGTLGFALSGTLRQLFGYAYAFSIMLLLQCLAVLFILAMEKKDRPEEEEDLTSQGPFPSVKQKLQSIFFGFGKMLTETRVTRTLIWINLFALGVEYLLFTGLGEIQYSYLRFKFAWGDKEYGWWSGVSFALSTLAVLTIYPFLHFRQFSDAHLSCLGTATKIIAVFIMAFLISPTMSYFVILANMFNRFVSTGYRGFLCSLIENDEQGKLFSLISLLEGVMTLVSAAIYSNLYPWSLHFFPGLLFLVSGILLIPSVVILAYSDYKMRRIRGEVREYQEVAVQEVREH